MKACHSLLTAALLAVATHATWAQAPATPVTRAANQAARAQMPLNDKQSFDDAKRGLIESATDQLIVGPTGRPVWTLKGYEFLSKEDAPDTVHPGLWRHARVNMANGLFKVTDRMYQVRGFDLSNMTIIEGDTGLIVVDPLVSTETAKAALDLFYKHRPRKPVVAVIYSHSHVDHFGGVRGVVNGDDVAAGKVKIIAPAGFMEEAVGENVIAGNAMSRRAMYQFGMLLPRKKRAWSMPDWASPRHLAPSV
jgi:alkyl sulfatase BDS1-like metallo-beta-lactamase superfamily hydrolase